MSTHHINANKEDVAKTVFMAGDPLRVKKFVETYLEDYKLVNTIRNELAYTGYYKGKKVSIFSHGMGLDSIGIYAYELYTFYEVENIIRFGSGGAYSKNLNLLDLVIAKTAYTESNYGEAFDNKSNYSNASIELHNLALKIASDLQPNFNNRKFISTTIHSSMWFYTKPGFVNPREMLSKGIDVVEMEGYALYTIANYLNKNALTLITVSDNIETNESINANDRVTSFDYMFAIILKMIEEI